ncbi:hypothetical protein EDB84DRAFT_1549787, partial [Lactarius hengduanensis]
MCSQVIPSSSLFPLSPTSCSRDCNDFPATSTPPHPHPLPLDPATSTWLRHTLNPTNPVTTTTSTPPRCRHLDTAFPLPRPRHLDTAATASTCCDTFTNPATSTPLLRSHQRCASRPAPAPSDTAPTAASTPAPPTRSPRLNPAPSALHARSPRQT